MESMEKPNLADLFAVAADIAAAEEGRIDIVSVARVIFFFPRREEKRGDDFGASRIKASYVRTFFNASSDDSAELDPCAVTCVAPEDSVVTSYCIVKLKSSTAGPDFLEKCTPSEREAITDWASILARGRQKRD